ncbi:MAG: hypothetical protein ACKVQU_05335 [Burkholderiales bacterium]
MADSNKMMAKPLGDRGLDRPRAAGLKFFRPGQTALNRFVQLHTETFLANIEAE